MSRRLLHLVPSGILVAIAVIAGGLYAKALAQSPVDSGRFAGVRVVPLPALSGPLGDAARWRVLRDTVGSWSLLRSPSSIGPRLTKAGGFEIAGVLPEIMWVANSALPYSINDGSLWAGRGSNVRMTAGVRADWRRFRVMLVPEYSRGENREYDVTYSSQFPPRPPSRNGWSSPFHTGAQSIDLPIRFGDQAFSRLSWGQTSALVELGRMEFGAATENNWWGPGQRNALLVSDNAEGFPHLFLRTRAPIETRLGRIEARWLTGTLEESRFFDDDRELRSIAMLGVTLEPRGVRGLTVGAARSVFAPARRRAAAATGFFKVFQDVGAPNAVDVSDTTAAPGPDQLLSLFGRWAFPAEGFEAYAEWGRAEFPRSLRDFLEQPNHTQAYTLGLQWSSDSIRAIRGRIRLQGEATYLQQSTTYRFRPLGSWYTSRSVPQGYTNRGQVIGAGIGPGSSSQWVSVDDVTDRWSVGIFLNRIRWVEDARSQAFAGTVPGNGWCEHDTTLLGGGRSTWKWRAGTFSAAYATGWRYNLFFQHQPNNCPFNTGTDRRVRSLSVTFTPLRR